MEYRTLGKTNLKVSAIGFGSWAIGGNMWGPQDDNDSKAALNKAIDLGVNFIDTALAYGNGHSEEIIGEVLKERNEKRENIIIATKIPPTSWPPSPLSRANEAFPKMNIITSVEQSLRNLNTDYIDIIQLHSWRENWTNDEEWYETLQEIKKQGKIRFIGISVHDNMEDEALEIIPSSKIDTIQVVYNVLSQSPRKNLFPKAIKHNIGIIARVPLAYGALTGKFTKDTTFPNNDFRKNKYTGKNLDDLLEKTNKYQEIVETKDKEQLIAVALYFALDHEAVSVAIPGIRNIEQAIDNCTIFNEDRKVKQDILHRLADFTVQKIH